MRHAPDLKNERGIALALAVFALVVIGALVAGTIFAGRLELQGGTNSVYSSQAFEAADAGLASTIGFWDTRYNQMATGDSLILGTTSLGANSSFYQNTIVRLSSVSFLLRSTGERRSPSGGVLARRMLAQLVRLDLPDVEIKAAVTARGTVTVGGNAEIDGHDGDPAGWASCGGLNNLAGVRTNDTVMVGNSASLDGVPPQTSRDSSITDSLFKKPFDALQPNADLILTSGSYNGMAPTVTGSPARCDQSNILNWGEPGVAGTMLVPQCASYFPIIYKNGNLQVQTGRGQGVLLVSGDLDVRGNFEFNGLIIVLGQVQSRGTGNKITGALLASNAQLGDLTSLIGDPEVSYSSCAVQRALRSSAMVKPLDSRSWAQIY